MFKQRLTKIYYYRATLWDMSIRQFKAGFAGLKLGIWWAFITPVLLAISINFVFVEVLKMEMANYTLFVLSGILPWFFFITSLQEITTSLTGNASILKQSVIPREFIPISVFFANFLNFILGLFLFIPVFVFFNIKVTGVLFLLPVVILLQSLFILGLGLLLSALNIFFRDLPRLLSIIFMFWFWVTPVFYSLDAISKDYRWICMFNPATYYIISYQNILFDARGPGFLSMMVSLILSVVFLIAGLYFFIKHESVLFKRL